MCSIEPRSGSGPRRPCGAPGTQSCVGLEDLARQVRLWGGEGSLEVGDGFAQVGAQVARDLVDQDAAAPLVFGGVAGIPEADVGGGKFFQKGDVVMPRRFCKRRLQKWHVLTRALLRIRELPAQVAREPADHLAAPAMFLHALGVLPADRPLEPDEFGVDGEGGARAGRLHPAFNVAQEGVVAREHFSRERLGRF